MKIRDLVKHMNNFGTNPRIHVLKHSSDFSELIYEGAPYDARHDILEMTVSSFTVRGVGFLEIHTSGKAVRRSTK